jgi:hypothetical protein
MSLNSVQYTPGIVPRFQNNDQIATFLWDELQKIKAAIDALAAGHLDVTHVEPAKLRDGDIRLADGTDWNPGSGKGVYWYDADATTWKLLG